jgi:tetratricopeptide (TPR) repeat protein
MPLEDALSNIRIGNHRDGKREVEAILKTLDMSRATVSWEGLSDEGQREQLMLLRASTLAAELADYHGDHAAAATALLPYKRIIEQLKSQRAQPARTFDYGEKNPRWRLLRQELLCAWQLGVSALRLGDAQEARRIIRNALHVAELMQPQSEGLLTQLYYADAHLRLGERDFLGATVMFRRSLVSASARFAKAGANVTERLAAQYSIAKALALGLPQSLVHQGRVEEARTVAVAGYLLLELTPDDVHRHHARQLLGAIERAAAAEGDVKLLESARTHLRICADFFEQHRPLTAFRARYELGLIDFHLKRFEDAERALRALFEDARQAGRKRWVTMAHVGLSRVARRTGDHARAVEEASRGRDIARRSGFRTAEIEAWTAEVEALFELHRDSPEGLKEAERATRALLADVSEQDVRSRVVPYLVLARIYAAMGNRREARMEYEEYERIRHHVQSARIHAFANVVLEEIFPPAETFRCPADDTRPNFNLEENEKAMRNHVISKARMYHHTVQEVADALGIAKSTYHDHVKDLERT